MRPTMTIAHHCNALMGRRWASSYIRVRMQSVAWQAAILRYPSSTNQTPDGFPLLQRSLYSGHHPRRENLSTQRLGRAAGRGDEQLSARRRQAWQPSELFPLVNSHHAQWREMRGGQQRPARPRAHGLGFRHQFRTRQQPAGGRSLPAARPARGASATLTPVRCCRQGAWAAPTNL